MLGSPRFLFRESGGNDAFATAARLSFGLWDSIPDGPLWEAAARGDLATADQIRSHAERMVQDRRTRAKVRDFLFSWLRVDLGPELATDSAHHPEFTPDVAADLRTSLELFLDDAVWTSRRSTAPRCQPRPTSPACGSTTAAAAACSRTPI